MRFWIAYAAFIAIGIADAKYTHTLTPLRVVEILFTALLIVGVAWFLSRWSKRKGEEGRQLWEKLRPWGKWPTVCFLILVDMYGPSLIFLCPWFFYGNPHPRPMAPVFVPLVIIAGFIFLWDLAWWRDMEERYADVQLTSAHQPTA